MKMKIEKIGLGLITVQNDVICFAGGFRSGNSPAGQTRLRYTVISITRYNALINEGKSNDDAQEGAEVGLVDLMIEDGTLFNVLAIQNIEIKPEFRKSGYGRLAVNALLAYQDKPLQLLDIKQRAISFWKKVGQTTFTNRSGNAVNPRQYKGWLGATLTPSL